MRNRDGRPLRLGLERAGRIKPELLVVETNLSNERDEVVRFKETMAGTKSLGSTIRLHGFMQPQMVEQAMASLRKAFGQFLPSRKILQVKAGREIGFRERPGSKVVVTIVPRVEADRGAFDVKSLSVRLLPTEKQMLHSADDEQRVTQPPADGGEEDWQRGSTAAAADHRAANEPWGGIGVVERILRTLLAI